MCYTFKCVFMSDFKRSRGLSGYCFLGSKLLNWDRKWRHKRFAARRKWDVHAFPPSNKTNEREIEARTTKTNEKTKIINWETDVWKEVKKTTKLKNQFGTRLIKNDDGKRWMEHLLERWESFSKYKSLVRARQFENF